MILQITPIILLMTKKRVKLRGITIRMETMKVRSMMIKRLMTTEVAKISLQSYKIVMQVVLTEELEVLTNILTAK